MYYYMSGNGYDRWEIESVSMLGRETLHTFKVEDTDVFKKFGQSKMQAAYQQCKMLANNALTDMLNNSDLKSAFVNNYSGNVRLQN